MLPGRKFLTSSAVPGKVLPRTMNHVEEDTMNATVSQLSKHPAGTRLARFENTVLTRITARQEAQILLGGILIDQSGFQAGFLSDEDAARLRALAEHDGLTVEAENDRHGHQRTEDWLGALVHLFAAGVDILPTPLLEGLGVSVRESCVSCEHPVTWVVREGREHVTQRCLRCLVKWLARALARCDCGSHEANIICDHPAALEDDEPDRSEDRAEFLRIQGAR